MHIFIFLDYSRRLIMINMKMTFEIYVKLFLYSTIFIISAFPTYSHPENKYFFKQLSLEAGLSQSFVKSIYEDHRGFLWVGTRNGLNKYDNKNFKTYYRSNEYAGALPGDFINFIVEDSLLNLWISTDQGLVIYNRESDSFTLEMFEGAPVSAKSYMLHSDGIVFGGNTLYKYSYAKKCIELCLVKDPLNVLKGDIYYIDNWLGSYWILANRWKGVWLYDSESGFLSPFNNVKSLSNSAFMIDENKNLWYSSYSEGLKCISPKGEILHEYNTKNSDLSNDIILDIKKNKDGIWIATDGGGICLLDTVTGKIQKITYDGSGANSLPLSSVYCLYFDKRDNLWAGTIRGGVFGIREIGIKNYGNVYLGDDNCLSERTVLSLFEDEDDNVWIGTDGGGINLFNKSTEKFRHFISTLGKRVVSITDYTPGNLLVSNFGEGLFLFDKKNGQLSKFSLPLSGLEKRIILKGLSINVEKISQTEILFLADSVYLFNMNNQKIKTLRFDDIFLKSYFTANNPKIIYSENNFIYLFSTSNIFRYELGSDSLHTIFSLHDNLEITDVCYDKKRSLFWIATTKGLFNYQLGSDSLRAIETKLFNSVNTLVLDKKERLWIGAKGLLFCYNLETEKFSILGNSDGVPLNEYNAKASILTKDNSVLKGGISGLLYIHKDYELEATKSIDISVMELLIDGLVISEDVLNRSVLEVPYDHSTLTLKVVAREADPFRKKMYRFNIVGSDIKPLNTYDNTLNLHSLLPGNYEINVSFTQRDGGWSEERTLLKLVVKTPWWKTKLFYVTLIGLFMMLGYLIPYSILRKKRRRLENDKKELERKNNEDRIQFLININHELRTPLTLIYTPLRRLLNDKGLSEDSHKRMVNIFKQVRHMKNMIDTLLDMRKMEVTKGKFLLAPHDINKCISNIAEEFEEEKMERKIELICRFDHTLEPVCFDKDQINIVLSNLLMNAFKYSTENSQIILQTSREDDFIRVSVIDEGKGLAGVDIEKLFTRFYQGENRIKGSGIGLAFSKNIIEMHHGRIGFFENEIKGATFYFELPLNKDQVEPVPVIGENDTFFEFQQKNSVQLARTDMNLSGYTILLVDDEPEILELLADLFMGVFGNVLKAANGKEALLLLKNNIPDIIVSDVMMPEMDGFELCRHIKQNKEINHIPVVLLTAFNNLENTTFGYQSGADIYIPKPFEDEVLLSVVISRIKNKEILSSRYNGMNIPVIAEYGQNNVIEKFRLNLNKIINDNIDNPNLSVQFVAEEIGISKASLYSKMKTIMGVGLNDYISSVRIGRACDYLLKTDMTVQQVSDMTGFNNQRYFSTVFKQITGVTPTKYREEHRVAEV